MIVLYKAAADELRNYPCDCGGFVQEALFVHAERCQRVQVLATLQALKAEVLWLFSGAMQPPHRGAHVGFELRWQSRVDVVRNRDGRLRSRIRTRDGSRILLTKDEHAALRFAADAILQQHRAALYPSNATEHTKESE